MLSRHLPGIKVTSSQEMYEGHSDDLSRGSCDWFQSDLLFCKQRSAKCGWWMVDSFEGLRAHVAPANPPFVVLLAEKNAGQADNGRPPC